MTLSTSSNPAVLERERERYIDGLAREHTGPGDEHAIAMPLSVTADWQPGHSLHDYARKLAAANGYTLTQLMAGRTYPVTAWRTGDREPLHRLAALTEQPPELLAQGLPPGYPPVVLRHPLTGWVDPDGMDHATWAGQLPGSPEARHIREDLRATCWPAVRLHLLTNLADALLSELTTSWPAHPSFALEDRAAVIADKTRHQPIEQWSPTVRRYALLTLCDHTYIGTVAILRTRTPVARDLLTAREWRRTAIAADNAGLGSIGDALRSAAAQWPPVEHPRSPTGSGDLPVQLKVRAGAGPIPGPFSVPALRAWPVSLVYAVHVADVALESWRHHQDPATAWTHGALQDAAQRLDEPVEPAIRLHTWGHSDREPPPYTTEACRLLATEVGRHVLFEVAGLDTADRPLPQDRVLRSWWPTLRRYPQTTLGGRSTLATIDPKLVAHLLWIDLTGHLPTTLSYGPTAFRHDLAEAAQKAAAEDILAMREWAARLIAGDDLPAAERRRTGSVGEANVR